MENDKYEIGMVGLGVMGRNLVLNMADHGKRVIGYDKDLSRVHALTAAASNDYVGSAESLGEFSRRLQSPRAVMMLVPAGPIVDSVIKDVLPYLKPGDLIIDGGNSHFKDTDLRAKTLAKKGIQYLGVGISGGESGARHGPSMMPGGGQSSYQQVRSIFEASAARVKGEPCVAYLGPGSAGHYVKMVHNGIEYGLMQLLAETYDLMKRGLGLDDDQLHAIYADWNQAETSAYLVEITANIFREVDQKTGRPLVDVILDEARQKGTGKWTSQDAMDLQVPVPTIDVAVALRNLSIYKDQRKRANLMFSPTVSSYRGEMKPLLEKLHNAFYVAMLVTYAQGLAQLRVASGAYDYGLDLETVARIWRGGCIIRAAMLEDIRQAYQKQPALENLLLDDDLNKILVDKRPDLHEVVCTAADLGVPTPAFSVSLAYFDAYHSAVLPANLIQAQRDYFGAHTYERKDEKGVFHTTWELAEGSNE
jgi:6-phosphogluconate dehydrogenase